MGKDNTIDVTQTLAVVEFCHKTTGEIMRIKKDYGNVVSVYVENPVVVSNYLTIDTAVCLKSNLEPNIQ